MSKHVMYKGYEVSTVRDNKVHPRELTKGVKKALDILRAKGVVQVERDDSPDGYADHETLKDIMDGIGIECIVGGKRYIMTLIDSPKLIQVP